MKEPILCYVDGDFAYFTTQSLDKQWGDDWDDAPYEHNAETPYTPCWHREKGDCQCDICKREWNKDGTPKWRIIKVAFEGMFSRPCDGAMNSRWSVRDINKKCVPWLSQPYINDNPVSIYAGTTLKKFKELILKGGGTVYEEAK